MIKSIIIVICFCLIQISVAQVLVGIQGGSSWGILKIDNQVPGTTNKTKIGSAFGVTVELPVAEHLSISVQPAYIQKGADVTFPIGGPFNRINSTVHLTYIQLPILLKFSIPFDQLMFYAVAGPNVAYFISAKGEWNPLGYSQPYDASDEYRKSDRALDAGLGIGYTLPSSIQLFIDGKYSYGMMNIYKPATGAIKTRSVQLWGGVMMPI